MSRIKLVSFFLSICFHFLLFLSFVFNKDKVKLKNYNVIELKVLKKYSSSEYIERKNIQNGNLGPIALDSLKFNYHNYIGFETPMTVTEKAVHDINNVCFYDYLYSKIDSKIRYPREFIARDIEGIVRLKLTFSPAGKYLYGLTTATSGSDYLRVYVIQILRELLKGGIPKRFINSKRNLNVILSFQFERTEHNNRELIENNKFKVASHLTFYRNYHKSKLQWELGPLSGILPAPVILVNPMWFYEKAKNLLVETPSYDPLIRYKEDKLW